ncbi:hypothetical protein BGX34_010336 [Mortierella sp. NVP85]|nr:hypothetical protein BGX34_010336 [Mortierella sp. NVP85]
MLGISHSTNDNLSPQTALKLAKIHLENAQRIADAELAALLYSEARAALILDEYLRDEAKPIAFELKKMLMSLKLQDKTLVMDMKPGDVKRDQLTEVDTAMISRHIFPENKCPPIVQFTLPEHDERLKDTPQLAYCLGLLYTWRSSPDIILKSATLDWLRNLDTNEDEVERLRTLATDVITTFAFDGKYDAKLITEVVCLAPILEKPVYRYLLGQLYRGIEHSSVMDPRRLGGLAQIIQCASPDYLETADLIKILKLFNNRWSDIHKLPSQNVYEFVLSVSSVLDAMADTNVKGLSDRESYEFISEYLNSLKPTSDPYFVYQAAYAYQALKRISNQEPIWRSALGHNRRAASRRFNGIDTVNGPNLNEFIEQLKNIDSGSFGEPEKTNKQTLQERLQEGRSFECRQAWYPALRMANALLRDGLFAEFTTLVCELPCRRDPAFQWGLCQYLKDLAVHPKWDAETRLDAVAVLEEMYRRDEVWGCRAVIKQRVFKVFNQLASLTESVKQAVVFDEADQSLPQKIPFPEQRDQLPFSKGHVSPVDRRHWCDPAWALQRPVQGHEVLNDCHSLLDIPDQITTKCQLLEAYRPRSTDNMMGKVLGLTDFPKTSITKCFHNDGNITAIAITTIRLAQLTTQYDYNSVNTMFTHNSDELLVSMKGTFKGKTMPDPVQIETSMVGVELRVVNSTIDIYACGTSLHLAGDRNVINTFECTYGTIQVLHFTQQLDDDIRKARGGKDFTHQNHSAAFTYMTIDHSGKSPQECNARPNFDREDEERHYDRDQLHSSTWIRLFR